MDLGLLARELQVLETDTFEIVDYKEAAELLGTGKTAPTNGACSTSSCTSTCSGTTSTTSTCA